MKRLIALLLFIAASAQGSTEITATVAITNATGTHNGDTIAVGTDVRTWTNSIYLPATQILVGTNQTLAASALLNKLAKYPFSGLTLGQTAVTNITLRAATDASLTVTLSAGWGTVTYATNLFGAGTVVTMPLSDTARVAIQAAVQERVITPLYPTSNGTNFVIDFAADEYRLSATNNVFLLSSTNWPATNSLTRFTGIWIEGGVADRGLIWNTNWVLLGVTNLSLTIPSNKVARLGIGIRGPGETNVALGWSVQQ